MSKTKLRDDILGQYAILNHGFASGLIGRIEKNNTGLGVSPYMHVTKSGIRTGISNHEDITVVEIT